MRYRRLGKTNLQVSALGFGASPLGGVFGAISDSEAIRAVHTALDRGINFFDVSPYYGKTLAETVLGRTLQGIPRDRYLLATKVGRYDAAKFDFSAARTVQSVEESLRRLGVETIDLIQCHDIEFGSLDQVVEETLPTLRTLQAQGKVRFIGITGLPLKIFPAVIDRAEVDTVLSYCHYHLQDSSLETLIPYVQQRDIGLINASPLSMGMLTQSGPPEWHPAPEPIRVVCAEAAAYCRERGADIAGLALAYALDNPQIATTLVGMASLEQLERNLAALESPPDAELLAGVAQILTPVHNRTWISGRPENN